MLVTRAEMRFHSAMQHYMGNEAFGRFVTSNQPVMKLFWRDTKFSLDCPFAPLAPPALHTSNDFDPPPKMSNSKSKVIHGQCGTASQNNIDRSKYHQYRVVDSLDSPLSLLYDDTWRHLGVQRVSTLAQGIAPDAIVAAEKAMPLPEGSKCHL